VMRAAWYCLHHNSRKAGTQFRSDDRDCASDDGDCAVEKMQIRLEIEKKRRKQGKKLEVFFLRFFDFFKIS
jgi:hypothetical protein